MRNLPILKELQSCDYGIVPTEWQKQQFPNEYKNKLRVIFDGVDESFFYPRNDDKLKENDITISNRQTGERFILKKESKILSYATRGMEPLRGFPEFMESLPQLLNKTRNLEVFIAGIDRRAYSYDAPIKGGSWKEYMIKKIDKRVDLNRIKFTGLLNYEDYRLLLWRTDLHCYFTRPYVTSWSLFEAASCGAKLALNRTKAVEGIVEEGTAVWIDIDNKKEMAAELHKNINQKKSFRSKILNGYSLNDSLAKWAEFLNECVNSRRSN